MLLCTAASHWPKVVCMLTHVALACAYVCAYTMGLCRHAAFDVGGFTDNHNDDFVLEAELHALITLFLNLALNLQSPESGLYTLQETLIPVLLSNVDLHGDHGVPPASPCIFSALTLVLLCTRDELEQRLSVALESLQARFTLALRSALVADDLGCVTLPTMRYLPLSAEYER
eukprot:m.68630 g.68630  ORF g.68630 m.68630 type:complete len:173 (-) comp18329_c0_seq3:1188-1706(-)